MFFVGIFGINQTRKTIGVYNNAICPACHAFTRYEIFKTYSYFHIFFIPLYKWDIKYYVKAACCSSIFELDASIGQQYEKNKSTEINKEHLHQINEYLPYRVCENCKARVESNYSFCPYCGQKF